MNATSPEQWLEKYGDALYGYAYARVRNRDTAEDLVQETLVAAFKGRANFAGESSERTWLVGILKHKIIDHWRRQARQATPLVYDDDTNDDFADDAFDASGHWTSPPAAWNHPDLALEQQQFWQVLNDCLGNLPAAQAHAFSLSEFEGLDGAEACKVLGIAPTNLWVTLHRARLRLRQCLEHNWFGREAKG
jgi:RNA polymerase sigma-70 factor, ECF subfamily